MKRIFTRLQSCQLLKYKSILLVHVIFFISLPVLALTQSNDLDQLNEPYVNTILTQLNQIDSAKPAVSESKLLETLGVIAKYKMQADNCIKEASARLVDINQLMNNDSLSEKKTITTKPAYFLTDEITSSEKQSSLCMYFKLELEEIRDRIDKKLSDVSASNLYLQTPIQWKLFDLRQFYGTPLNLNSLSHAAMGLLLKLFLGYLFVIFSIKFGVKAAKSIPDFSSKKNIDTIFYGMVTFVFTSCYLAYVILRLITDQIPFSLLSWGSYLLYMTVAIRLYLDILIESNAWLETGVIGSVLRRIYGVITLLFLYFVGYVVLDNQSYPLLVAEGYDSLFSILLNLSYLWLGLILFKGKDWHGIILLSIGCVLSIALALMGYQRLGFILIPNLVVTWMALKIFWDNNRFLGNQYHMLSVPSYPLTKMLNKIIIITPDTKLAELFIVRLLLNIPIILCMVVGLYDIWGIKTIYQAGIQFEHLHDGIYIFNMRISPTRMLRAVNIFCYLVFISRVIVDYCVKKGLFTEDKITQNMYSSFVQYILILLSLVLALSLFDIDFSGIIVIAGALSVGLGFGLKNFISNFFSGLYLMINKPIKIRDHVVMSDTDGFVKKIGFFSTQLTTSSGSDVFIANANITDGSITNFNFKKNKLSRIKIKVFMENSSDFLLANQLLLDVVKKVKNIKHDKSHEPIVLYELDCVSLSFMIKETDKKNLLLSEIGFAIINEFKKHKIKVRLEEAT